MKNAVYYHQDFLNYLKLSNRSERTIESYDRDLRIFIKWCRFNNILRLESVKPKHLSLYQDYLSTGGEIKKRGLNLVKTQKIKLLDKPLAVSSRRRHFSTLKNFFAYLLERFPKKKWIPFSGFSKNPVLAKIHAIRLKDSDVQHTSLLKEKDWEKLQELRLKPKDRLFLSLMYWGGLRLSEVKNLTIDQFDFETKALDLHRKGGKRHRLYLIDDHKILHLWDKVSSQCRGPYLFTWGITNRPLSRRAAFKKVKLLFKKAGLGPELTPHSLRKACATRLYQQTKDLLFVRDYLGHSDAKVTQTYIELRPDSTIMHDTDPDKPHHHPKGKQDLGSGSMGDLQYSYSKDSLLGERLF
ncbi:MAG: tyrosine-type recombinase/integrase [Halobacteriovoraceae bacterium]|nr:tyrosine-type recombinase/integrase [Halobacteriovoraceae bacterium]